MLSGSFSLHCPLRSFSALLLSTTHPTPPSRQSLESQRELRLKCKEQGVSALDFAQWTEWNQAADKNKWVDDYVARNAARLGEGKTAEQQSKLPVLIEKEIITSLTSVINVVEKVSECFINSSVVAPLSRSLWAVWVSAVFAPSAH